jgi:hypothetical protein
MRGVIFGALWLCLTVAAEPARQLPADVPMAKDAGRGGLLVVTVRLEDGETIPMAVDTGAPLTLLDKSLASKLGKRQGTARVDSFYGKQNCPVYRTPKLYLGGARLMTGSNLFAYDFRKVPFGEKTHIKGILGMDCLQHYCVQLDFAAGKMRFLNSHRLEKAGLGKAYGLMFTQDEGDIEAVSPPFIQHSGLLGGTATKTEIDTGNNMDGMAEASAIRKHAVGTYSGSTMKRVKHYLAVKGFVNKAVGDLSCVWDGNQYTDIAVSRAPSKMPSWIGLRFLARHLVTLDFPNHLMYLKQESVGPREAKTTE